MNQYQRANRRSQRPRPYDLRRRVLLKNFLREQMSCLPASIINENDDPGEQSNSDFGNEQSSRNVIDNLNQEEEKSDHESKLLNDSDAISSSGDCNVNSGAMENSAELLVNYNEKANVTQCVAAAFDVADVGNSKSNNDTFVENVNCSKPRKSTGQKSKRTSKTRLRRKFFLKIPYSFSKRRSLRDTTKTQDSISKAKHHLKCPQSPQKRKSTFRVKFSNFFSPSSKEKKESLDISSDSSKTKKSDSLVTKLFKTKDNSLSSEKNSNYIGVSLSSRIQKCNPAIDGNGEESTVSNRSVSIQTEVSGSYETLTNEDYNSNQILREENKRLMRSLNYLISVNSSNYWLRSSEEKKDTQDTKLKSALHGSTNQYNDENCDYSRLTQTIENSAFHGSRTSRYFENSNNLQNYSRLTRSKSIQEYPNNKGKLVWCRRVKSVYIPSGHNFRKNSNAFVTLRSPLQKVKNQTRNCVENSARPDLKSKRLSLQGENQANKPASSVYRSWSVNVRSSTSKHDFRSCRRARSIHAPHDSSVSYRNMPAYKFS